MSSPLFYHHHHHPLQQKLWQFLEIKSCVMIILSFIQHVKKMDRKSEMYKTTTTKPFTFIALLPKSVVVVFIALDGISIEDELWAIYFFNIVHHHPDTFSLSLLKAVWSTWRGGFCVKWKKWFFSLLSLAHFYEFDSWLSVAKGSSREIYTWIIHHNEHLWYNLIFFRSFNNLKLRNAGLENLGIPQWLGDTHKKVSSMKIFAVTIKL